MTSTEGTGASATDTDTSTDTGTTATATTATANGQADADTDVDKDWQAEAAKWKSLARKHETSAKTNATAAKKLADIEESQKSAQEKLQGKVSELETEIAAHRAREIQADAVHEAGLDADMAQFITETEPDKALAQAKALAKRLVPPKADLKQGARQNTKSADDMNAWIRNAAGYSST
jgi:hypothetical protein